MKTLKIQLTRPGARVPTRETAGSLGYDVYAALDVPVTIPPGGHALIPLGFCVALEAGYAAFLYARSGLGVKHGIVPRNCVGVIDSDYRGEVVVGLANYSDTPYTISPQDRVAQMIIQRCALPELILCAALDKTERGAGGFGSTGHG